MPSPTALEIGATQFENVRARLDAGFGFFEDGPFHPHSVRQTSGRCGRLAA